jgi:deazaflavin-dependent oxidoreductase (nitroreductase family)
MPLPQSLARFNRKGTNRITRPLAAWLPGFGVVTHTGRTSGRVFTTPVNAFRRPGGWVFALTYGQGDWVRNVMHAGGASLRTRGRDHGITNPRVERDPARRAVPGPVRAILGWLAVDEFLYVDEVTG